jgi:hypothetical protein
VARPIEPWLYIKEAPYNNADTTMVRTPGSEMTLENPTFSWLSGQLQVKCRDADYSSNGSREENVDLIVLADEAEAVVAEIGGGARSAGSEAHTFGGWIERSFSSR